jgi:Protein of unknown function (DUF3352)
MSCSSCGASLVAGSRFCNACGGAVERPGVRTSSAVAEPPSFGPVLASNVAEPAQPQANRAPRRRIWPFVVGGLVALLAVAAAAAYIFVAPYFFSSGFRTAAYFPRDTWLYADMTVRPGFSQLLAGKKITEAFTSQPGYDQALQALQSKAPAASNVDFEKEMLPLLDGEVAVGTFGSTTKPDALVMLHSSDPQKLLRLLAVADKLPEPRDYYGSALYYAHPTSGAMTAAINGWIVIGSSRSVAEQAINRLDTPPSDSLAHSDRYLSVVTRLPSERVGFAYFDSRPVMSSADVQKSLTQAGPDVQRYVAPLSARVALSIAAASDGLDMRWESIPDQPLDQTPVTARGSVMSAFDRMPSDTLAAVGGDSLPSLVSGAESSMNSWMKTTLGNRAPQLEISRWLGGEFALGVTKGTLELDRRGRTQGSPDVALVAKVKDPSAANTDILGLDRLLQPKLATVHGVSLKQVGTSSDASAYYGLNDQWMYLGWGQTEKFVGGGTAGDGLTATSQFGLVRRAITPDGVAVYVDIENTRRAMEDLVQPVQRETYDKSRVLLQPIKALGGSVRTDSDGDAHGELLLIITK